jgi:hypothetical protein
MLNVTAFEVGFEAVGQYAVMLTFPLVARLDAEIEEYREYP